MNMQSQSSRAFLRCSWAFLFLVLHYSTSPACALRIVGGSEVAPNSIPWQVSIQDVSWNNWHLCGGTVLSADFVLTGARCCQSQVVDNLQVVGGDHDLFGEEGTEQKVMVQKLIIHEGFDAMSLENDVCIIKLNSSFVLNQAVSAVQLPLQDYLWPAGSVGRVSGWGKLVEDGPSPSKLQAVTVPLMDLATCQSIYGSEAIKEGMLCAGQTGMDACQGDGGGPLCCGTDYKTLCGIVSWGVGCGVDGFPGVYTDAAKYTDWIHANME